MPVTEWLSGDDLQTKLTHIRLAKPMDSTGGEIVLDERRQPTVRALCRERRRHWGGKTSPHGTTEASCIAGNNKRPNTAEIETQPIYAPNHSSK